MLTGLLSAAGLCLPVGNLLGLGNDDIGLPTDDCLATGGCSVKGNGVWDAGRTAYIEAHYGGEDPHPEAQTRFEFYQAEIEAAIETEGTPCWVPSAACWAASCPNPACAPPSKQGHQTPLDGCGRH
ncbi:hypothetical protein ACFQFQ_01415 [Sulfitobacter porphyrae]|uniref:Uncharacterized protein n=1 Tax=Sulfitobacter porphyrae TaxID=1246864 RepID=A0ABW2AZQ4_9RHOB